MPTPPFPKDPTFGETEDLAMSIAPRRDLAVAFTISSGAITIKDLAGVVKRNAVACTVDNTSDPKRVYYYESFTTANGYIENGQYIATFKIVTSDGSTEYQDAGFTVQPNNAL